jgi:hypothetical protein
VVYIVISIAQKKNSSSRVTFPQLLHIAISLARLKDPKEKRIILSMVPSTKRIAFGRSNIMSTSSTARKKGSLPSSRYLQAHGAFSVIVAIVALYGGAGMMLGGRTLALPLFDALGFGPNTRGLDPDAIRYCIFAFGVLGCVLVGWMVLIWSVVRNLAVHPDAAVRAHARQAILWSTGVWFVFDTGFSLATGEYSHAAFNVPFVSGFAVPMYIMETSDACDDDDDDDDATDKNK